MVSQACVGSTPVTKRQTKRMQKHQQSLQSTSGFQNAMHGGIRAEPTICKGSLPAKTYTASGPVTARTAAQGEAGKATLHVL